MSFISFAMADKKINLLIVSTFSKDYVFVREESANGAVAALKKTGFSVENIQNPTEKSMTSGKVPTSASRPQDSSARKSQCA